MRIYLAVFIRGLVHGISHTPPTFGPILPAFQRIVVFDSPEVPRIVHTWPLSFRSVRLHPPSRSHIPNPAFYLSRCCEVPSIWYVHYFTHCVILTTLSPMDLRKYGRSVFSSRIQNLRHFRFPLIKTFLLSPYRWIRLLTSASSLFGQKTFIAPH